MTNGAHPEGAKGEATIKDGKAQKTAAHEEAKDSGEAKKTGLPEGGESGR